MFEGAYRPGVAYGKLKPVKTTTLALGDVAAELPAVEGPHTTVVEGYLEVPLTGMHEIHAGYGDSEYAEQSREKMRETVMETKMNLLGASRYATEMVVMRDQMPGWFTALGVDADFVMPDDPWQ